MRSRSASCCSGDLLDGDRELACGDDLLGAQVLDLEIERLERGANTAEASLPARLMRSQAASSAADGM
jgi:hypothetical protein